jgi:hypothetical protein
VGYVRQSSQRQVVHNLESQRRQYSLADDARQLGFREVQIIDEDLGRSGSGSGRQALLWFRREKVELPQKFERSGEEIFWRRRRFTTPSGRFCAIRSTLARAFGKTESRTKVVDGRARKTDGHKKPMESRLVLLRDHHHRYITWEQFEQSQAILDGDFLRRPGGQPEEWSLP